MIGHAAPILIGNPGPARIGIAPVAVSVGAPIGIDPYGAPTMPVLSHIDPLAVRIQCFEEEIEAHTRLRRRGGQKKRRHKQRQESFFHQIWCSDRYIAHFIQMSMKFFRKLQLQSSHRVCAPSPGSKSGSFGS